MSGRRTARVWSSVTILAQADAAVPDARYACLACAHALDAVGVGLSLTPGYDVLPEPAIATSRAAEILDELQFTIGQGPTVDAARLDRPMLVADLASTTSRSRWPAFAAAAGAHEAAAIFAFPVSSGGVRVGVLSIYRDRPGHLTGAQLADAFAYADVVLMLALNSRGGMPAITDGHGPSDLTEHRAEVHQAAGMVSAQLDVDVTEALVRIRAYAYSHDRRLTDVAHAVLNRELRFGPDDAVRLSPDGSGPHSSESPAGENEDREGEG